MEIMSKKNLIYIAVWLVVIYVIMTISNRKYHSLKNGIETSARIDSTYRARFGYKLHYIFI
jgi:predicted secreted protein